MNVGRLDVDYGDEEIFLLLIELLPNHRGQGLGSRLIRTVLDRVAAEGKPLVLNVLEVNRRAYELYRRLGFTKSGASSRVLRSRSGWLPANSLASCQGMPQPNAAPPGGCGSGWHGFGGEDSCDDYGAVPDSPERRCVGGFARRRGCPRCGVAVA